MEEEDLRNSPNGTEGTKIAEGTLPYGTLWNRAYRHLDYHIIQTLQAEATKEFDLDTLRFALGKETGIRFQKETLRKYLDGYTHRNQGGPFFAGPDKDTYLWNGGEFRCRKIRPPKQYGAKSETANPKPDYT